MQGFIAFVHKAPEGAFVFVSVSICPLGADTKVG